MSDLLHPAAPHHLPKFIPGADGSDPLFTFVVVTVVLLVMAIGIFYLKLHSLPERMAHRQNSTQMQLIAVLAVLALFTHNNAFWVLALLLAVVRVPDFSTPLNSIAASLEKLSGREENGVLADESESVPEGSPSAVNVRDGEEG